MDRLARLIYRRRRFVLAFAFVFVLFAGAYGGPVVGLLDSDDDFEDHGSESVLARDAVERATGRSASPDMVVLVRLGAPVDSPQAQEKIARVAQAAARTPTSPRSIAVRDGEPAELVSRDGRSTYLLAIFGTGADDDALAEELQARVEREPGVTAGGGQLAFTQVGEQVEQDLARAEMLAFPLLFLLSLVVFRSVVAALLPVLVGGTTIITTFVWMRLVNEVEPMSVFAINLITGAGLGLAIDYSLFVVSRFREELATGAETAEALRRTMRTAGRTVLFSAVTVAAAMAALIVFDLRFLFSMGYGGVLVALTAALVSLTVLPGAAGRARAARERAQPQALEAGGAARRRARAGGPLVPLLAVGDEAAGADRRRHRRAADRDGAAVPADRVHRRRRERAADGAQRARGAGRARHRVPARPQRADLRRRRDRRRVRGPRSGPGR